MIDTVSTPVSRSVLALDLRDGPVMENGTGYLVGRSLHRWAWSRSTSLASVPRVGGTYTAPRTVPGWSTIGSALGLALGVNDVLRTAVPLAWRMDTNWCAQLAFRQWGAMGAANATLFAIADDDPSTGVRAYLYSSGTYYGFYVNNGVSNASVALSAAPVDGDTVSIRMEWVGTTMQLQQSINGAAYTTVSGGAPSLPTGGLSGATYARIGRRGDTENPAALIFQHLHVMIGSLSVAGIAEAY